jgi:hypothetical protein
MIGRKRSKKLQEENDSLRVKLSQQNGHPVDWFERVFGIARLDGELTVKRMSALDRDHLAIPEDEKDPA